MTIKIIVARYNEDMEWTKQFPNVIIYNKGEPLNVDNELFLENVGREGHTYYKYICDNYDTLDDYTVFLQGNPFDHSPNIIANLNNLINNTNLHIGFVYLSELMYATTLEQEKYAFGDLFINIENIYEKIFGIRGVPDKQFVFGAGAQFVVSKNNILKNPKEFYENIVKILEYSDNPIEGHFVERFHKLIFCEQL